ncbi:MAG: TonB-dependent receptor [Pseudomonadota bacterium]
MQTPIRLLLTLLSAASLYVISDHAAADELEEIVVTATRLPQALESLPYSANVIEVGEIQRARPLLGLDEALQGVPGLLVQNRYNFAQDLRISVRGFGARSAFGIRGIRVLVDGIPATLPDGQSGVDGIDVGATGRIELLRGSAGARYGNAGGGVLLVETLPGEPTPTVSLRGAIGSDGYERQQVSLSGVSGDWNYRASISDLNYDGYREHSAARNRQVSLRLAHDAGENSDWLFTVHHTDQPEAFDPGGINLAQADANPRSARDANISFGAGEALEQTRLGLRYRRALNDRTRILWRQYATQRTFDGFLPFGNSGAIDLDRVFFGGGLQIEHQPDPAGRWGTVVAGIDIDRQRDERQRFNNDAGQRAALTLDQEERVSANGVFLLWQFEPSAAMNLEAALRYDSVDFDVDDRFLSNGDDGGSLTFDAWSPSLGLSFAVAEGKTIYANVARSFETPTTTELANPGTEGGFNASLDPQIALQFEVGTRITLGAHSLSAALYKIDLDDELIPFELEQFPGRDFFANAGATDRQGVEFSVRSTWHPNWFTEFSYTFSDFEFSDFVTDDGDDFSGNRVPGSARHQYFGKLQYADDSGWLGAIEVARLGPITLNNQNTVATEAFTRMELRLARTFETSRWRLEPFVAVSNALDETYTANARINAFGSRFYEPGPDRAVFVGFEARRSSGSR